MRGCGHPSIAGVARCDRLILLALAHQIDLIHAADAPCEQFGVLIAPACDMALNRALRYRPSTEPDLALGRKKPEFVKPALEAIENVRRIQFAGNVASVCIRPFLCRLKCLAIVKPPAKRGG